MSSRPRRQQTESNFDPTLSRGILSILLVMAAILVTLSFFNKAGAVGIALNEYVLASLFGIMRYALPLLLLIIAWFLIRDIDYNYRATHGLGALLFFLTTSSLFHMVYDHKLMWQEAILGHGGGIFGMGAYVLKTYLGSLGSYVILGGFLLVSIILIFNTSITAFILLHKKILDGFGVLGRSLVGAFRTLFVRKDTLHIQGAYSESPTFEDNQEEAGQEPNHMVKNDNFSLVKWVKTLKKITMRKRPKMTLNQLRPLTKTRVAKEAPGQKRW